MIYKISGFTRWQRRGQSVFFAGLSSLLRDQKKKQENHQRISTRWIHEERGCSVPFHDPEGVVEDPKMLAASLNAFFWASPVYGSADGVTSLLTVKFC